MMILTMLNVTDDSDEESFLINVRGTRSHLVFEDKALIAKGNLR